MKVAVVGSRTFNAPDLVNRYVQNLPEGTIVISGCANGVDTVAENAAKRVGLCLHLYPVKRDDLAPYPEGRQEFAIRAYKRNALIALECDRMVAFWDERSKGTLNVMKTAKMLGRTVEYVNPLGEWKEFTLEQDTVDGGAGDSGAG